MIKKMNITNGSSVNSFIDSLTDGYFPESDSDCLQELATIIVKLLTDKGLKLATAESCTGGLLSELITSVPNASGVFGTGICTYSPESKISVLGVPASVIEKYGVYSDETAYEMASRIRGLSCADIGVSVTGIAGPSGGTAEKPVGTVYIGFSTADYDFTCRLRLNELDVPTRTNIREYTAASVFEILEKLLLM